MKTPKLSSNAAKAFLLTAVMVLLYVLFFSLCLSLLYLVIFASLMKMLIPLALGLLIVCIMILY